ncbi:MAG: hypothetical protein K2H20_03450, partial [Bacilli bacterium]|nr:hypothetical protein [Bacilli bacterium]
ISSEPKTLQELGDYFNVTKEAVRLTEERVKEKVRKMFADDHTLKRKYINDIKQEYPFESIKIEPCPLENYTMFFYIRDKFSPEEQTILKEILLSKLSFDSKRVATEIIKSEEYVIRKSQEIKKIIYKTSRDIHFKLFHNYFVKKYKNKIYHLELDSDISECLDIRNIVSEYWQDKTLEEVFEFASSSNIPYTKETLEIIKRFYGEASKKDIKYNKNRLERDVNYSIYGFIIHEIPHSKLYSTFLQNQNKFTQKQRDYLNAYVFKKKKKVPKNPLTDKYYYGTSAINKLILLYYRIEDYKNDNFSCEKYISIRNRCIKDIDKRGIKLLDLYYGINGNEMTIREIAEHLCEDATEVENDFRRAKNNAITIYLGTGQYNFDKTIYSKVLQDESLTLGNPHYQVARMFFLEGKSYEEIANEFEINPKFTARKVSELIKYACNAMDYYRFGITSTQKNYPKDFLIDVLKNAKYDKETKDIINTFIETKSTITTADIHKRNLEEIRNIIRKFNSSVTKASIEQVEITKEDVELSVTEHESTNVLNEREKAILSLYYGLKNKYNPSGKIKYPIDIGELLGIKNNVGTAIRKAKEHVAAHKIGLLKTAIDFINREELESILRNKRIPLSKEDKNIIINAYGLYETEYLTIKEIAQKYSLAEPIARKRLYKGIITIKKYLNKEIEGEVLFETDIEPYLKYFILEDREILTLLYKEKKTQSEIEKNYGFSTHQFNTLLQKIRMHLSDLRSGISSGIDFDYFWSYALEKDLPFYGNQQLAAELCFLYYEKRLTQSDIVKYHHPELGDTTVSELIKEFTAAIIKHQHGIKKANEFSFEAVANYFNKNKDDFKAVRLKIYKRYFDKIKRNGPYTKVH